MSVSADSNCHAVSVTYDYDVTISHLQFTIHSL
jgi:hypothetical protein